VFDLDRKIEDILYYAQSHPALTMVVIAGVVLLLFLLIRGQE
jgi:hypothetical protein